MATPPAAGPLFGVTPYTLGRVLAVVRGGPPLAYDGSADVNADPDAKARVSTSAARLRRRLLIPSSPELRSSTTA